MAKTSKNAKKLTRNDIIADVISKNPNFIKAGAKTLVNAALDALAEAIASGHQVEIRRLGVFSAKYRPPRKSRNPRTGESINVGHSRGVRFKMSRDIKKKLAELPEKPNE
jgi:integration host factor subunit beta